MIAFIDMSDIQAVVLILTQLMSLHFNQLSIHQATEAVSLDHKHAVFVKSPWCKHRLLIRNWL
jgi:hypothetical protein